MTAEEVRLSGLLRDRARLQLEALKVDNTITAALTGVLRQRACDLQRELHQVNAQIDSMLAAPCRRRVAFGAHNESRGIVSLNRTL